MLVVALGHVGGRALDEADQGLGGVPAGWIACVRHGPRRNQASNIGVLFEVDCLL